MIKSIKIMNYIVKEMFNRKTKAFLICENSKNHSQKIRICSLSCSKLIKINHLMERLDSIH